MTQPEQQETDREGNPIVKLSLLTALMTDGEAAEYSALQGEVVTAKTRVAVFLSKVAFRVKEEAEPKRRQRRDAGVPRKLVDEAPVRATEVTLPDPRRMTEGQGGEP